MNGVWAEHIDVLPEVMLEKVCKDELKALYDALAVLDLDIDVIADSSFRDNDLRATIFETACDNEILDACLENGTEDDCKEIDDIELALNDLFVAFNSRTGLGLGVSYYNTDYQKSHDLDDGPYWYVDNAWSPSKELLAAKAKYGLYVNTVGVVVYEN